MSITEKVQQTAEKAMSHPAITLPTGGGGIVFGGMTQGEWAFALQVLGGALILLQIFVLSRHVPETLCKWARFWRGVFRWAIGKWQS